MTAMMMALMGRTTAPTLAEHQPHHHRQQGAGITTIFTCIFSPARRFAGVLGVDVSASSSWTSAGFLVDSGFTFPVSVPRTAFL